MSHRIRQMKALYQRLLKYLQYLRRRNPIADDVPNSSLWTSSLKKKKVTFAANAKTAETRNLSTGVKLSKTERKSLRKIFGVVEDIETSSESEDATSSLRSEDDYDEGTDDYDDEEEAEESAAYDDEGSEESYDDSEESWKDGEDDEENKNEVEEKQAKYAYKNKVRKVAGVDNGEEDDEDYSFEGNFDLVDFDADDEYDDDRSEESYQTCLSMSEEEAELKKL